MALGEDGYEYAIYTPRGRPGVKVVSVHMNGVWAEVERWRAEHPDATEEEINEAHWLAAGNREHWARGPEDYSQGDEFYFFEINDQHEIVGPSPGPVED